MFLTTDELAAASGRTRPSAQLKWALSRGLVPHDRMTDADGRPLVLRALFHPQAAPEKTRPNFGALRGTQQA
jgi:hypothetical protein